MWVERSFVMSHFRASILTSMVKFMEEVMVEILELICFNYCWAMERSNAQGVEASLQDIGYDLVHGDMGK
jgi:hypothetical protein